MSVKYQIFISSTYEDLKDERNQVIQSVLEMGHIPVGMEMFSAADEEQWKIIQRAIDSSDYYVVLVANRYGSITPEGVSYTRKEYEYALSIGVPILGFVIEAAAKWPGNLCDAGRDRELLDEFKELVRAKPVSRWSNAHELHGACAIALGKAFHSQPRPGWVRSTAATSPELAAEISRLSSENAELRGTIAELEREESERAPDHGELLRKLSGQEVSLRYRQSSGAEWEDLGKYSYLTIFNVLGPPLIPEGSFDSACRNLAFHLRPVEAESSDIVPHNYLRDILLNLMAIDLVEPSTKKHSVHDYGEYWSTTQLGRELLRFIANITTWSDSDATSSESTISKDRGGAPKKGAAKRSSGKTTVRAPAKKVARKKPAKKKVAKKVTPKKG